jgi:hypothetical protein
MGFRTVGDLSKSIEDDGKTFTSFFFKSNVPGGGASYHWADTSVGSGTPKYNAYVGNQGEATQLINAGNNSIYLGPEVLPGETKHLVSVQVSCAASGVAPLTFMLQDYCMFYPLIDGDSTDEQLMDNPIGLPRYKDGDGLRVMFVCAAPMSSSGVATVVYRNEKGVSGRSTQVFLGTTSTVGVIASGTTGAFNNNVVSAHAALAPGDNGIQAIESVTMNAPTGGFFNIVIVKPITTIVLPENSVAAESNELIWKGRVPEIKPGAFLSFIFNRSPAFVNPAPVRGFLQFAWR